MKKIRLQMANKHEKNCWTSLVIRQMHNKTMRHDYTHNTMAIITQIDRLSVRKGVELWELCNTAGDTINNWFKKQTLSIKVKYTYVPWSSISTQRSSPTYVYVQQKTCTAIFSIVLS